MAEDEFDGLRAMWLNERAGLVMALALATVLSLAAAFLLARVCCSTADGRTFPHNN